MNIQSLSERFHRQYSLGIRISRILLSLGVLGIGGLIYIAYRSQSLLMFRWGYSLGLSEQITSFRRIMEYEGLYGWVKYSLPDGLWLFAYMFIVDSIWNGARSFVSYLFIFILPFIAIFSEILQYWGIAPGVFDWVDMASYIFAILLFLIIKLLK